MRGVPSGSPLSTLFLFMLTFLLLKRRGVDMLTSLFVACALTLCTSYGLSVLREANSRGVALAVALRPGCWTQKTREQLKVSIWLTGIATLVLLVAGLLTGRLA